MQRTVSDSAVDAVEVNVRDGVDAELLRRANVIAIDVAGKHSKDVDSFGRFPIEAIDATRQAGLLGAYVPATFGGSGASVAGVTAIGHALAKRCSSAGMVYAMHQIQVACLVHHHGGDPAVIDVLREIAAERALVASATTEAGIGGDLGSSTCSVERLDDGSYRIRKDAPVISYGDTAQLILATARRSAEAAPHDQVLAIGRLTSESLVKRSTWDALGMRGTCSNGYTLDISGPASYILATPYAELSPVTMIPFAHLTWAGVWSGIAADAVDTARRYLRTQARKTPGTVPAIAADVADLFARLTALRGTIDQTIADYQRVLDEHVDHESRLAVLSKPSWVLRLLTLKTTVSTEVLAIVEKALYVCGFAGYSNATPFSLGRHLRDAHSARLMVHNERILANAGALLCVAKE